MNGKLKLGLVIALIGFLMLACKGGSDPGGPVGCSHDWNVYTQTTAPTCITAGLQTQTCKKCGITNSATQAGEPAKGHDWLYTQDSTPATCIAPGSGSRECQREGCDEYEDDAAFPIDPNAHDFNDDWQETKAPSITEDGELTRYCQREDCEAKETKPIERLYAITMQTEGNGTAVSNPNNAAARSETVTITAAADPGNIFIEWQVITGGVTLSNTETEIAAFTMPGNAVTIKAIFDELPITVEVTNNIHIYNGTPQGATVAYFGNMNEENAGAIIVRYVNAGYDSEIPPINAGDYNIMVTTAGGDDYPAITVPLRVGTLHISKAGGAALAAPILSAKTSGSITVEIITASTGQSVEYGISTSNTAAAAIWQITPNFAERNPNITYYIFARAIENSNYNQGAASSSLTILKQEAETFTITFMQLQDEELNITGPEIQLIGNESETTKPITVDGQYDSIKYFFNGSPITGNAISGDKGRTLTVNPAFFNNSTGTFYLTIEVEKDGLFYSNIITVTVRL